MSLIKGKPAQTTTTTTGAIVSTGDIPDFQSRPDHLDQHAVYNPMPQRIAPIWPVDSEVDVTIYVSPTYVHKPLKEVPIEFVILQEKSFRIGDYKDARVVDKEIPVPKAVQANGTLYAHFYVALAGRELDPYAPSYDSAKAYHFIRQVTQYLPKKKVKKAKSLLGGSSTTEEVDIPEDYASATVASYYHPNFTMSFIPDSGVMPYTTIHPAVRQHVHVEPSGARDGSGQNGWYYPILFHNTFWQLKSHMVELNATVPFSTLPIHIDLNNQANWKFSIVASIDEGNKQTARLAAEGKAGAAGDGSEFEMVKEILLDTNIYLLATTFFVSILHMLFEMLAFKSDISHFRNKKDNVGISVRSILGNVFMQAVIFLYLLDNNENTSWMILATQGLGIVLEFWKVTRVVNVRLRPSQPGALIPYKIVFEDKHVLSDTEEKTKEYDAVAFKYLYMVAVPLLLAYAVYSLIYETHKSWYSFVITTLVGSVYAYGFLMMVPSLYINYRLKSVAHMPAKAMTYKFLNTFIDDLFAFTIKMPTLHRLATLRDDVIFFVYLYQSWKYKVDYNRVNEFGQGGEDIVETKVKELKEEDQGVKVEDEDTDGKVKMEGSTPETEKFVPKDSKKATGRSQAGRATKRK